MNGGAEQQQRVPARRRAEQRQPGRQQHRLRAAGGSRPGNENLHELVRRAVRPHRRRRRQRVAEVGHATASTAKSTITCGARRWPPTRSSSTRPRRPKTDQYIDQYGFSVDGPIWKNKTFFLFTGEKYREGTPAPLVSTVPTPAMKNGDFSGLVDASGRQIVIYDPATGRDVNGVWTRDPFPGNIIPANRINRDGPGDHAVLAGSQRHDGRRGAVAAEPAVARALQQGPVLELGREGRPQLRRQRPGLLPLGRERAERDRQQRATPSAAVPARPASFRSGAPTARSSATGCTSSGRARSSTCAAATPISWSGAIPITRSASIRRSSGPRASSTRCPARRSAASSRVIEVDQFATLSRGSPRTGTATTRFSRTCR